MAFPRKPSLLMKYKDEQGNMHQYTNYGWKLISSSPRQTFEFGKKKKNKIRPNIMNNGTQPTRSEDKG